MEHQESDLFFRYHKGLCTKAEMDEVEKLLNESETYRLRSFDSKIAWALGEDIKLIETVDVELDYKKIKADIRAKKIRIFQARLVRYAGFLTIPLLLSSMALGYLYFKKSDEKIQYTNITATVGSVVRYELPDNSVVWLNSGSKLRCPNIFKGGRREVDLQGEAFFEVQSNEKHPFYVNTPSGVQVYVCGTRFNVCAYDNEDYVETVLESGRVNIFIPKYETSVALKPGEHLLYDKKTLQFVKSEVDVSEKVAWKDGKLIFRNSSLEEVLKRLSRHFNVDISFNNRSGKQYRYRATFRDETLSQILDYLSKSAMIKWKTEEESVLQSDRTFVKKKIIVDLY